MSSFEESLFALDKSVQPLFFIYITSVLLIIVIKPRVFFYEDSTLVPMGKVSDSKRLHVFLPVFAVLLFFGMKIYHDDS